MPKYNRKQEMKGYSSQSSNGLLRPEDFENDFVVANDNSGNFSRGGGKKGGRGGGRPRPPPGLRGAQIGLFYRNQALEKKAKSRGESSNNANANSNDLMYFSLDSTSENTIRNLLADSKSTEEEKVVGRDQKNCETNKNYTLMKASKFKEKFLDIISGNIQEKIAKSMLLTSTFKNDDELNKQLKEEYNNRKESIKHRAMTEFCLKLPSHNMKNEIIDVINENQILVISGETGCGKTTQVPQYILDDAIQRNNGSVTKIVCTQPRRISAISVAERVAAERGECLGKSVGYQIRLEQVLCRDYGSILFCTTGLLLQFMQNDPALRQFSHIILDEIHERTTENDFIITLLKQVMPKRPDLKLILMSATLNSQIFSKYYENCPILHIPGFTYPVTEYYMEDIIKLTHFRFDPAPQIKTYKKHIQKFKDKQKAMDEFSEFMEPVLRQMEAEKKYPTYVINQLRNPLSETLSLDLIEALLEHICNEKGSGAILVFLPGLMDISNLIQKLCSCGKFPQNKYRIYPLHSRLPTTEQKLIFDIPPQGVRKIIIATSIAETSITIEDVVYVIDCGRTKLARYDVIKNIELLEPEWVSLANAKQRRGRAGRVQPGECYRLYTRAREMIFDQYPTPEMLRTPLDQVILRAKLLQLGRIEIFLGSVLDPPSDEAIASSLNLLQTLNAIDNRENLTPLGYHLARLPLDPRTGKMIIWAAMFSCVDPILAIAASLSFKDAFYCPIGDRAKMQEADTAKLKLGSGQYSDHIMLAEAVKQFEKAYRYRQAGQFCSDNFLSFNTLNLLVEMKQQFAKYLYEMKFLHSFNPSDSRSNKNSHNVSIIKAIVCAGLFPNIAVVEDVNNLRTLEGEAVKIHPASINSKQRPLPTRYLTYYLKQKSTAIFLHDTTCIDSSALLFAAPRYSIRSLGPRSCIDLHKSLSFRCKNSVAHLIKKLCDEFNQLLEDKISHPGTFNWDAREGNVLRASIELISGLDLKNDMFKKTPVLRPSRTKKF